MRDTYWSRTWMVSFLSLQTPLSVRSSEEKKERKEGSSIWLDHNNCYIQSELTFNSIILPLCHSCKRDQFVRALFSCLCPSYPLLWPTLIHQHSIPATRTPDPSCLWLVLFDFFLVFLSIQKGVFFLHLFARLLLLFCAPSLADL